MPCAIGITVASRLCPSCPEVVQGKRETSICSTAYCTAPLKLIEDSRQTAGTACSAVSE